MRKLLIIILSLFIFSSGYPDTLGLTTDAGNNDSANNGLEQCFAVIAAINGTISKGTLYASGNTLKAKMCLRNTTGVPFSTGWAPSTLVANTTTAEMTFAASIGWVDGNVASGATLTANTTYWICTAVNNDSVVTRRTASGYATNGQGYYVATGGYAAFPTASIGAYDSGRSDGRISAYFTYAVATPAAPSTGFVPTMILWNNKSINENLLDKEYQKFVLELSGFNENFLRYL